MTRLVRALIVDDEAPSRTNLRLALADHEGWELALECASVEEARRALAQDRAIDVVFLDVQMPQESGVALARELARQTSPPIIVFVTAYQHYAVQAFEFHALDYLLKPFDDNRFTTTLRRVEELIRLRHTGGAYAAALQNYADDAGSESEGLASYIDRVCVRSVGQIECIEIADVDWIISSGNYVELHLASRVVLHRTTLSEMLKRLDPKDFVRVHRRAMVRRSLFQGLRVVGDGSYLLDLKNGDNVPVSERYVDEVRSLLLAQG